MSFRVHVVSSGRPKNVPTMQQHLGTMPAVWLVKPEEVSEYQEAGAEIVVGCDGGLIGARNAAIELAKANQEICVQISDDFVKIRRLSAPNKPADITLSQAVEEIVRTLKLHGGAYAGVAPTDNPFYGAMQLKVAHFIVGDLIAVDPKTPVRFDSALRLKEDYDFTCQVLQTHGMVLRLDWLLATFQHYNNAGGAVAYRCAAEEQSAIAYLKKKWGPAVIRDNPKRPNEVLLKWGQVRKGRS